MAGNPAVLSTIPLDYHISIINQLFGPGSAAPPAVRLPSYLVGLPDRLHSDDIEYLRCSGALDLPSETLRNELLKSYLLWVHPHMPILGMHEFLSAVAGDNESHRISLLLFHAVLFAASAFVDECHIRAEGYPSRSVFRESISCKVKVHFAPAPTTAVQTHLCRCFSISNAKMTDSLLLKRFCYGYLILSHTTTKKNSPSGWVSASL